MKSSKFAEKTHRFREERTRQRLRELISAIDHRHQQAMQDQHKLLVAVRHRLAAMESEIGALRADAVVDDAAETRYLNAVKERGRLHDSAERIQRTLNPPPLQ